MNTGIAFARKMSAAYTAVCKPLCQSLHLPQTAFDILMFLGNNPEYSTARDIVEVRQIKANLVSVNVDRLVKDGYLSRKEVAGDRRKTQLLCTKKAAPVIKKGQDLQQDFADRLIADLDDATKNAFFKGMAQMETTLDMILKEVS